MNGYVARRGIGMYLLERHLHDPTIVDGLGICSLSGSKAGVACKASAWDTNHMLMDVVPGEDVKNFDLAKLNVHTSLGRHPFRAPQ